MTLLNVTPCVLIVPIDVDRDTIQEFNGRTFPTVESFKLAFQERTEKFDYELHPLEDFCTMVNDELGFNDVENWIGYVYIEEDFNTLLR